MAFMVPVYEYGTFALVTSPAGESYSVPLDCCSPEVGETVEQETGWFCRLSAPSYMDCTEWSGPFETEDAARDYIRETFDVDPDTGDDIEDDA